MANFRGVYLTGILRFSVLISVDPSAALRTPVLAGPNGVDRVLGDKERRVMEIFLERA